MENQRKVLFGKVESGRPLDQRKSDIAGRSDGEIFVPQAILKGELISVFIISLIFIVVFAVMYFTNRSSDWISAFSEKVARLFIPSF